jgi:hypothetical protein
VDDFSGQYFLRNALRKCIAGGFPDESIQLPAKSAEVPVAHRIPQEYFIVVSHRQIPPILHIKQTFNGLSLPKIFIVLTQYI